MILLCGATDEGLVVIIFDVGATVIVEVFHVHTSLQGVLLYHA